MTPAQKALYDAMPPEGYGITFRHGKPNLSNLPKGARMSTLMALLKKGFVTPRALGAEIRYTKTKNGA